ncbi:chemotaxis protein [Paenibacillus sp. p3-SID867]|uniref:chemotaxis protein n=1 Tax=Paenibacillus sp. p3-SID867 TaxID=2916363 RepID=UPI0021A761E9|nr:chemotaxis protein [Paenibacillus sp. p3-SID867]MCT1402869.1 chemotaxis protein [Paenibacillus sp. p3-SID867]
MKIALGFVHGIGKQKEEFHETMAGAIRVRLSEICPEIELISEGIYWADITDRIEDELKEKLAPNSLHWDEHIDARGFAISFLGDAIAYQPLPHKEGDDETNYIYNAIHLRFYEKLQELAQCAGPNAPLCIISHSLGTIIASNFLYDLQNERLPSGPLSSISENQSSLVRGDTVTHFYTMGSPIAIWTMRYKDFGRPIAFPSPALKEAGLPYGEWVNFYEKMTLSLTLSRA